ncbi:hypothetical protein Tco_1284519 [Tanacetum coccineum]
MLADGKFLKIKQVVEEEQFQPEYLQELLQSLLEDLQILNEIQPLKQEISNQIQKDQRKKIEDMSIDWNNAYGTTNLVARDREIKEIINDLGYRRFRGEEINEEYERDCEIRIQKLKQDFNIWGSEVRKKEKGKTTEDGKAEDTTSIDDLPLDDSMIFPEYESFTFDDEPVMADVNVFDEINTVKTFYPGIGENVVSDEEEIP